MSAGSPNMKYLVLLFIFGIANAKYTTFTWKSCSKYCEEFLLNETIIFMYITFLTYLFYLILLDFFFKFCVSLPSLCYCAVELKNKKKIWEAGSSWLLILTTSICKMGILKPGKIKVSLTEQYKLKMSTILQKYLILSHMKWTERYFIKAGPLRHK